MTIGFMTKGFLSVFHVFVCMSSNPHGISNMAAPVSSPGGHRGFRSYSMILFISAISEGDHCQGADDLLHTLYGDEMAILGGHPSHIVRAIC